MFKWLAKETWSMFLSVGMREAQNNFLYCPSSPLWVLQMILPVKTQGRESYWVWKSASGFDIKINVLFFLVKTQTTNVTYWLAS